MIRIPKPASIRRFIGGCMFVGSSALWLLTLVTYTRQPDHYAAFTVMPVWIWAAAGLAALAAGSYLRRTHLAWFLAVGWLAVVFTFADEARLIANIGTLPPRIGAPAPHQGKPVIRVMTANCNILAMGDPSPGIAAWQPDILLLQDAYPPQVRRIAKAVFGADPVYHAHESNGIISRWPIEEAHGHPNQRTHQAIILMPDGQRVKIVNVHLLSAATNLSLWRRVVWRSHRINRAIRHDEMSLALDLLESSTEFPEAPTIFAGDFNAPPGDTIYRQLNESFQDAFPAVGTRWGNTFHRRFPILRIDRIHATHHWKPVRARAIISPQSNHRFVVADFLLDPDGNR